MLGIFAVTSAVLFAVKSAVLIGSVSDHAKLPGIVDLPLNKDALFKDAFAMEF